MIKHLSVREKKPLRLLTLALATALTGILLVGLTQTKWLSSVEAQNHEAVDGAKAEPFGSANSISTFSMMVQGERGAPLMTCTADFKSCTIAEGHTLEEIMKIVFESQANVSRAVEESHQKEMKVCIAGWGRTLKEYEDYLQTVRKELDKPSVNGSAPPRTPPPSQPHHQ